MVIVNTCYPGVFTSIPTMFALFEAGLQRNGTWLKPHVSASPHVGLSMWHLSEVLT